MAVPGVHRTLAAAALVLFVATSAAAAPDPRDDRTACEKADNAIRTNTPVSTCRSGNGDLVIGHGNCKTVYVDRNYTGADALGAVTIGEAGALLVPDSTLDIEVKSITVVAGTGAKSDALLQIGTAACPIGTLDPAHHVTVKFTGDIPLAKHVHHHDHKSGDDCTTIDKGIGVGQGGRLALFGARGVVRDGGVSWTHLAQPAGPDPYQMRDAAARAAYANPSRIGTAVELGGELRIHLAKNVKDGPHPWRRGDWIVVGTTSFSPFESEFVQIDDVDSEGTGSVIRLMAATPLRHYHFGGADPGPAYDVGSPRGTPSRSFSGTIDTNFGVDERAEVGLVSRSVTFTAQTPRITTPGDSSLHWGGEMRFCKGYTDVSIEGVEIEKFGKEQLGSYPLHFHKANQSAWTPGSRPAPPSGQQYVDSNSIHHSYNKCGTIHSTSNITFSNNVCARITGHVFYQEIGDEFQTTFVNNLGLGAMLNGFGLAPALQPTPDAVVKGWWEGDYLGRAIAFDGLKIANTDSGTNPSAGMCYARDGNGGLTDGKEASAATCPAGKVLYEAPSGFWIVNPTAVLDGNSIGGCQSNGKGYWYVSPRNTPGDPRYALKFQPVGKFTNNRVHGCYDGIFGETDAGTIVEQLQPKLNGDNNDLNLIARFDGFTASRIRNRGVWMRPLWFVFENARIASSREDVSLVTSGGLDGNGPGAWGLLKNSTVVGWSRNNIDRWGPCPDLPKQEGYGCVDRNPQANDLFEKGYPTPAWNFAGFYIYDGPVRIHDTRFVNFRHDIAPLLTSADASFLDAFTAYRRGIPGNYTGKVYEGDAALGWFQNNQSAYPTSTEVRGLVFENTNLRHQVFTEKVNFGNFDDGDKNTAVIDRDGSLTGFRVVDATGAAAKHRHPVSLNNLPFNATSNAVDECLSTGAQDQDAEGRPTSLISPADIATLEFGALTLPDGLITLHVEPKITQLMTFTQDAPDLFGLHRSMTLHSRNNQGVWEPKIASGHGYTVHAASAASDEQGAVRQFAGPPGIPRYINVGLTDVIKPDARAKPFHSRLGVCYTNKDGSHPPAKFAIERGYRSWGGNGTNFNDLRLRKYFNKFVNLYDKQTCHNLDHQQNQRRTPGEDNTDPLHGCPADGVTPLTTAAQCTADGGRPGKSNAAVPVDDVCIYETKALSPAASIDELTNADGTPKDLAKYFYDATTGMLFFYVVQDAENAQGASPLGSCKGQADDDPACPNPVHPQFPETYYGCPAQGCVTYTVRMDASVAYDPGASACGDPSDNSRTTDPTAIYRYAPGNDGRGRYAQPRPTNAYALAYVLSPDSPHADVRDGKVVDPKTNPGAKGYPHVEAAFPPYCAGTPDQAPTRSLRGGATGY